MSDQMFYYRNHVENWCYWSENGQNRTFGSRQESTELDDETWHFKEKSQQI